MKNLSPQTRQKLAILLKSRESQGEVSPNLSPPPVMNTPFKMNPNIGNSLMSLPKLPSPVPATSEIPLSASHMANAPKFNMLRQKLRKI